MAKQRPESPKNIKLRNYGRQFTEKCEGCGSHNEVHDFELLSNSGRQLARMFLCKSCRSEAATLMLAEVQKNG